NPSRGLDAERGVPSAGSDEGYANGPAARARFHTPSGIAVAPDGSLYVADTGNHRIRAVTPAGGGVTVAGRGGPGRGDGRVSEAQFNGPIGIAVVPTARAEGRSRWALAWS